MHIVPDDGFDHDTSHVSMNCPCNPYLEPLRVFGGSAITHREMKVPDHFPRSWVTEESLDPDA